MNEKIKKYLTVSVVVLLVVSVFAVAVGSAGSNPIEIEDWYDLDELRDDLGGDYVLMNDLDEETKGYDELVDTENGWEPIPSFGGTLDGNGHEINSLYIDSPELVGLFRLIGGSGVVTDISLVDIDVSGGNWVGGLAGANKGTVEYSNAEGIIRDGDYDCVIGGLVGMNEGSISNSYARVDVTVRSDEIGGLVGLNWGGTVSKSYSTGYVNSVYANGGLVGRNSEYGTVKNSFWDIESSEIEKSDGGTGKTTADMKNVATYTDTDTEGLEEPWDFVDDPHEDGSLIDPLVDDKDIWKIDDNINDGYPSLAMEEDEGSGIFLIIGIIAIIIAVLAVLGYIIKSDGETD